MKDYNLSYITITTIVDSPCSAGPSSTPEEGAADMRNCLQQLLSSCQLLQLSCLQVSGSSNRLWCANHAFASSCATHQTISRCIRTRLAQVAVVLFVVCFLFFVCLCLFVFVCWLSLFFVFCRFFCNHVLRCSFMLRSLTFCCLLTTQRSTKWYVVHRSWQTSWSSQKLHLMEKVRVASRAMSWMWRMLVRRESGIEVKRLEKSGRRKKRKRWKWEEER